jgi:hypothetical protein
MAIVEKYVELYAVEKQLRVKVSAVPPRSENDVSTKKEVVSICVNLPCNGVIAIASNFTV